MGFKDFANGYPLNATEVDNYLMRQTVMVFADSTARTAALTGIETEGMFTYLTATNATQYYNGTAWVDLVSLPSPAQPISNKTANYSIIAGDAYSLIRSTNSAITVTISDVLTIGQRIDFAQFGTGQITFAAGAGVTLNSADSKVKTAKQYAGATVECVASGVYWLVGNLGV